MPDTLTPPPTPEPPVNRRTQRVQTVLFKRRRQKKLRVWLGRLLFMVKVWVALLLAGGLWWFWQAPFWTLTDLNVQVSPTRYVPPEALESLLAPEVGKPVFAIHPAAIAQRIQVRFPVLAQVQVRRYLFPARLEVKLAEQQAWALVYESPDHLKPYGLVTDRVVPLDGLKPVWLNPVVVPKKLASPEYLRAVARTHYQLRQIPELHLHQLDASQPNHWVARFAEVDVLLGKLDMTMTERLRRLVPLVPKIQELENQIDWVDLRWGNEITFHRKTPALPPQQAD
jgi:cell division septal protein FtsQ